MMYKNKIIKLIKENRISTTEVADALGKKGIVPLVKPMITGKHLVGEVQFFYAFNKSNWELHEQIQDAKKGVIAFFYAVDCGESALFGDLVSKYLMLYKQVKGIVTNGYLRDAHNLLKEQYPIWCKGTTPIGCFNRKNDKKLDEQILVPLFDKYDGGIMVCDDSGVVLIDPKEITEQLYNKLEFIEYQEDIWYFCLDRHKMSTYEIVCLKEYLKPNGLIDNDSLQKLSEFSEIINKNNEE